LPLASEVALAEEVMEPTSADGAEPLAVGPDVQAVTASMLPNVTTVRVALSFVNILWLL
jgi:hypothetical protein